MASPLIFNVSPVGDVPKVCVPVVVDDSVLVVDGEFRPCAGLVDDRQPVRVVVGSVNLDLQVPASIGASGSISCLRPSAADAPIEKPGFGIVDQQLA